MKLFSLQLAWFISLLSLLAGAIVAVISTFAGNPIGIFLGLASMPVALAHMTVFDYVHSRLAAVVPRAGSVPPPETLGTPWHNNPGHTL